MRHQEDTAKAVDLPPRARSRPVAGFRIGLHPAAARKAAFGLAAVALGVAAAIFTSQFPGGSSYDSAGPRLFPGIVAAGLIISGLVAAFEAVTSAQSEEDDEEYDILPPALIASTLLAQIFILKWIGWPLTAAMVFAVTAWVMGSRRTLRDVVTGFVFGIVTLLIFNVGLGLNLPLGVFAGLLPAE